MSANNITPNTHNEFISFSKSLEGDDNNKVWRLREHINHVLELPCWHDLDIEILEYCDEIVDECFEDAEKIRLKINQKLPVEPSGYTGYRG